MEFYAEELYIKKFRKIENQTLLFGRRINVISGQNGVGKSNIMALIAATFGKKNSRFSSGNFHPEYNNFFTISQDENYKDYETHLKIVSSNSTEIISKRQSFKDDTKENRSIRLIPRNSNHFYEENYTIKKVSEIILEKYKIGAAARIPIPAIISTLSRLYPVGETQINNKPLRKRYSSEVKEKYTEYYNKVIPNSIKDDSNIAIIEKSITKKNRIYINLNSGTEETQSVGQDSLGNIITALSDFYQLKISDPDNYNGGILCIDELDASLHPKAQLNLMELLDEISDELNLQVFLTTHSLTILKCIIELESKSPNNYKLIYLLDPDSPRVHNYSNYTELKADMFDELGVNYPEIKIYCEDDYTEFIFKELEKSCETILKKKLPKYNLIPIHLGCENLLKLPKYDSHFGKIIIVLDGDAKIKNKRCLIYEYINKEKLDGTNKIKTNDNFIFLPTFLAPESYLYYLMYSVVNDEKYKEFWNNIESDKYKMLTKSKLKSIILDKISITTNTRNDDLKIIFNEFGIDNMKELIEETDLFYHFYKENPNELNEYYNNFNNAVQKVKRYFK